MSIDVTAQRSRRAVLAAAAGAAAATVAAGIGQPRVVRAGSDGDVVLGGDNSASMQTSIKLFASTGAALLGYAPEGDGLRGTTDAEGKSGVYGSTSTQGAYGVFGRNWLAKSEGALGSSVGGVTGFGATGVAGESADPAGVGVLGFASLSSGQGAGVHGRSQSPNGIGGRFEAVDPAGTALSVLGRARFTRSGRTRISAGKRFVDVDLTAKGGLAGTPLILATLQYYRSGVYVAGVRPKYPSAGRFRIYLNKALTSATYVAWFVIG